MSYCGGCLNYGKNSDNVCMDGSNCKDTYTKFEYQKEHISIEMFAKYLSKEK